jgi:hypothetical protein
MKLQRIFALLIFAILLNLKGLSQSAPPWTIQEIDGSPRVNSPTLIKITNGALSCSGKTCTITVTGGSGSPGGASGTVQWNDSGAFNGTSGLTATATTITIVNGVTATFSRAGVLYTGTVTTDNSSVQTMLLQGDRATVASNDEAYVTYRLSNAAGTQTEVARMTWAIPTATAAAENGRLDFSVMTAGALAKELQLAGDDLSPSVSDGLALGTVSLPWSDIFLATGAIIDFANNDSRITHSSGVLTVSAGDLRVTTAGTNAASVATLNGTQSFQNKTITNSNNVLGGVTMTLGSDANGDTYYRASGVLTRLAKGTAGQVLTMNAGATAPEWAAAAGGSGITIGTTTVTSGTGGRFIYETTGNVVGEISTLTSDGTIVTFSPTVTTGTGATSGLNATANSLTTGTAFHFSSSSVTSGSIVNIASTSTAGATGVEGLNIAMSGANGTTAQTVTGATIAVTNTNATSGTNKALVLTASGATTLNTALEVTSGRVTLPTGGTATNPQIVIGTTGTGSIYQDGSNFGVAITDNTSGANLWVLSTGVRMKSGISFGWTGSSTDAIAGLDLTLRRSAAANLAFGAADAASPVAQTLSVQNVVAGTSNTAGVTWTQQASLGTSQGAPGRHSFTNGALITASGTTQQTAVSRLELGATKVLTNNTVTTVVNVTDASNTVAAGFVEYAVEVFDGTDLQVETGSFTYQVTNKGGTIANNTITFAGASGVGVTSNYPKNTTTSGTLAVTWAISAANPALLSVNANSSLTPSTGYPRVTYSIRNLTQQAIAVQ